MYILQKQLENLKKLVEPNKVVAIFGPRRVGKTTLIKQYMKGLKDEKVLFLSGDEADVQKSLSSQSIEKLRKFIGDTEILIIDEAQKIDNIGLNLKIIVDHIEGKKIITTGSSSFDLNKKIGEPLVGRKWTLRLFPFSQMELGNIENYIETQANLESRLIYGSYPQVIIAGSNEMKKKMLNEITGSYLIKDILELEGVRNSKKVRQLLELLAWQIGKEVSLSELGNQLELSKNTVERYLDLLEQTFIIINIRGFSRNLRKEVTKTSRYYFYDNGVRNALINNFNLPDLRDDIGMLWENYLVIERIKKQEYQEIFSNNYFWRTYDQKEIDWVEERDGKLFGYEIKWSNKKKVKAPKDWIETYKNAEFKVINQENYLEFIT
ncbi:ATP-binding protein [bacterium]|nr:MAG: ATP-binding protein [bacterium]